jgi:anti-sigma B factor antagonist
MGRFTSRWITPAPPAEITLERDDPKHVRMSVRGELDVANADLLGRALRIQLARGRRVVSLDMSEVAFIDVVAMETILGIQQAFQACDGTLFVIDPSRPVGRLLHLAGLESQLIGGWFRTVVA